MKIAIGVSGDLSKGGLSGAGFKAFITNLREALEGHEIIVFSSGGGDVNLRVEKQVEFADFKIQYENTVNLAKEFAKKIEEINPDLVLTFNNMGEFLNRKHLLVATSLPYKTAIKLLGEEYPETEEFRKLLEYYKFLAEKERENYSRAGLILTTSIRVKEAIIKEYRINSEKVVFVPLPVYGLKREFFVGEKEEDSKMKIIIMPSELRIRKGIKQAIEAMKILKEKIPEAVLLVCGRINGYEKKYIQELLSESKGKANIILAGFLSKEEYYNYIKIAECGFLPAICEGQSEALSECISFGLPVVSGEYNQYGEEIITYVGYCVKDNNIQEYANKLVLLLSNKDLNQKKRDNCKIIARRYSKQNFKGKINNVIEKFGKS